MGRGVGLLESDQTSRPATFGCSGSARCSLLAARRSERGVALIAAIFLLVALASLGVYMVTISGVQQQTPTLAADASRAWYAARSGIEALAYEATTGASCPTSNPKSYTLDGFDVQVSCSATDHTEQGEDFKVFRLEAFAEQGTYGGLIYVSRTATATVTTAP